MSSSRASSFSSTSRASTSSRIRGKLGLTSSQLSILESQAAGNGGGRRERWRLVLEVAGISAVITVIVALMSLPVVFFYIPTNKPADPTQTNGTTTDAEQCRSAVPYSGSICREELLSISQCFPGDSLTADILVVGDSSDAQQFIPLLEQFGSEACLEAARPFLCVYFFGGVCDSQDVRYFPTALECEEISTGVCRMEWELARSIGMEFIDCSTLPREGPSLCANSSSQSSGSGSGDNDYDLDLVGSGSETCVQSCRENFFCNDTSLTCQPQCPDWSIFPKSVSSAIDIVILTTGPIGLVAGVGVLVISCLRWKKVYVFPSILIIYQTVDLIVLIMFHLATYFDRSYLYCTSTNLLESILNTTSFCVAAGIMLHYMLLQINLWWVLHTAALFWKVHFPAQAKALQSTIRLKLVHTLCIAVALLLPLPAVVAPIIDNSLAERRTEGPVPGTLGYGFALFPPILCSGLNSNITFYTVILPNVFLVLFGTVTLVLTIWKIHKTQGLFLSNQLKNRHTLSVSTAEKKLIIVFCYYILLQVVAFVTFSLSEQAAATLQTELFSYFLCEQNGHDPDSPCSRAGFEGLINPGITILSFILAMLAPTVNFVFVIDYQELKEKLKSLCQKLCHRK